MSFFRFLSTFLSGRPDGAAQASRARPRVGGVYRRFGGTAQAEYAEVTGLRTDEGGIRHVRFELVLVYRDKTVPAGERTLSAESFARRFPQPVDTPPDDAGGRASPDRTAQTLKRNSITSPSLTT